MLIQLSRQIECPGCDIPAIYARAPAPLCRPRRASSADAIKTSELARLAREPLRRLAREPLRWLAERQLRQPRD